MNLQELLEELRDNLLRDMSDEVDARNAGQLWTDRALVRYINDGMVQFAVQTCLLRDETTPELTRIVLVEGQEQYAMDERVVAVYGARVENWHLSRTTYAGLFSNRGDVTLGFVRQGPYSNGRPHRFYTDRETNKIGIYPPPSAEHAGDTLILRVARKPLQPLVATNLKAVPEIPEEHHLDILEWAAWRALRNHDVDAENMAKASAHKTRFNDAVKELSRKAKRLQAQDLQFDVRTNWEC
ncbi:hypothetical protein D3C81_768560 [compost metagenome]